jgi:hypothetical protein
VTQGAAISACSSEKLSRNGLGRLAGLDHDRLAGYLSLKDVLHVLTVSTAGASGLTARGRPGEPPVRPHAAYGDRTLKKLHPGYGPEPRLEHDGLSLLLTPSAASTLNFRPARWVTAAMLTLILTGLLRGIRAQHALVLENLALRHQLAVLQRTAPRPRLRPSDRLFFSEAVCQELARWSYQLLCSVPPP